MPLDVNQGVLFDDFNPTSQFRILEIDLRLRPFFDVGTYALIDFHRCQWKTLVAPTRLNPEGVEGVSFDERPGVRLQVFHSLWRSPRLGKIGDAEHPGEPSPYLGGI